MGEKFGVDEKEFYAALKGVMKEARKPGVDDTFELWKPHLERLKISLTKKEFFDFWFSGERIVPELIKHAKELRQNGIKVYILSNNFKERTEYYRRHHPEIFENVDGACFSCETGFVKPDPRAWKYILVKNKLKPEECIYFDDSKDNIKAAKKLRLRAQKYKDTQLEFTRNYR